MVTKNSSPVCGRGISYQRNGRLVTLVATALRGTTLMTTTAIAIPESTAFFTRAGDAYAQFAIPHVMPIEHTNSFLRLSLIAHFHESEALGLPAITVLNQCH